MSRNLLLSFLAIFTFHFTCIASDVLKGKVIDHNGLPIAGASVFLKNSTQGVVADNKGNFTLHIKKGDELTISAIGYQTIVKKIINKEMVFILKEKETQLEDIIIETGKYFRCYTQFICKQDIMISRTDTNKSAPKITSINVLDLKSVYPNPTRNELRIIINSPKEQKIRLCIIDLNGKEIKEYNYGAIAGNNDFLINVGNFINGTYFIKVVGEDRMVSKTERFIKM